MTTLTTAWRAGRAQRASAGKSTTLAALVVVLVWLVSHAARVPLLAVLACACIVSACFVIGLIPGLVAAGVALLFLEWRVSG